MANKYTIEFKQEAVKLVTEQGYSQADAGRALGVSDKNINRWVLDSRNPKPAEKFTDEQEELRKLRKEVKKLRMEHEILKKAAAFFASQSR